MLASRKAMLGNPKMKFVGLTTALKATGTGTTFSIAPHADTRPNDLVVLFMGLYVSNITPTPPAGFTHMYSTGGGLLACTGKPGATPITLTTPNAYSAVAVALSWRNAVLDVVTSTGMAGAGSTSHSWGIGAHAKGAVLIGVSSLKLSYQTVGLPTTLPGLVDLLGGPLRSSNSGLQLITGKTGGAAFNQVVSVSPDVTSGAEPAIKMISLVRG